MSVLQATRRILINTYNGGSYQFSSPILLMVKTCHILRSNLDGNLHKIMTIHESCRIILSLRRVSLQTVEKVMARILIRTCFPPKPCRFRDKWKEYNKAREAKVIADELNIK
jgi:hypothetical protein